MNNKTYSKLALVTGGSSGIGKTIAEKLNREGVKVIVGDVAEPEQVISGIEFRTCDISQGGEIDSLYSWIPENHGYPDYLILNAVRGISERLFEGDPEK